MSACRYSDNSEVIASRNDRERGERMFVLSDEIKAQATQLREALEKVAMREDIHERQGAWLFALCETLGELGN